MSLATVLGDKSLIKQTILTLCAGLTISLSLSILIGILWPYTLENPELIRRTEVGFASVILALSAGCAAVLSLTQGTASALVGVMVSVALLPPIVCCGLMIGSKQYYHAEGAAVLFAVNIACINIAANIVFLSHRITPRNWFDRERAKKGYYISFAIWLLGITFLCYVIFSRQEYFKEIF